MSEKEAAGKEEEEEEYTGNVLLFQKVLIRGQNQRFTSHTMENNELFIILKYEAN